MRTFTCEAGRLLCGTLRDFLNQQIFLGKAIRFHEGSGFFSRTFTIRGEGRDFDEVVRSVIAWAKHFEFAEPA